MASAGEETKTAGAGSGDAPVAPAPSTKPRTGSLSVVPGAGTPPIDAPTVRLALPKGRMQENVFELFREAGISVTNTNARGYRPTFGLRNFDVKLLKPQNILGMLHTGSRDLGFGGADWVAELGLTDELVEVLDTGLDPVRLVAAAPNPRILAEGTKATPGGRRLIVASEYEAITRRWIKDSGIDAEFFRAYGATESLPPEDCDVILDNTATGSTLVANKLEVIDTVMHSTTRMYASKTAWADSAKRACIEDLAMLLRSVLDARQRIMITCNVATADLEALLEALGPEHKSATVAPLRTGGGFAVQVLVARKESARLLPSIKAAGGEAIVVSEVRQFIACACL